MKKILSALFILCFSVALASPKFSEWFEHYVEPEMQQNINENIRNAFENIPIPVVQ